MLVVAGPGSGKTTVITRRIRYLTESAGVSPAEILVITFTRAAAHEMEGRYLKATKGAGGPVRFSTFHALFYWIIKTAYNLSPGVVIDEEKKRELIGAIMDGLKLPSDNREEQITSAEAEISRVKCEGYSLDSYYSTSLPAEDFRRLYNKLDAELKKSGKIDFDDMMVMCRELLTERPDILERLHRMYRYILVDEFQDSNPLQYELLKLLAHPADNLFCVGDDDQSVYGFRGASPNIMQRMKKEFSGTKLVKLTENYRCDRLITEASAIVIEDNRHRFKKKLVSASKEKGTVKICETSDDEQQVEHLIGQILAAKNMGIPFQKQAVIFRINAEARRLVYQLEARGIPYIFGENTDNKTQDMLNLLTMHGAKGLEFDCVYMIDAVEGYTPYRKAKTPEEREEERRMFYVAMTRARHSLTIYVPQRISGKEYEKSRFIKRL